MGNLEIKTFVLGMAQTNTYVLYHRGTKEAVVVDPADDARRIIDGCKGLGVAVQAILLTHGHFDHILAVDACRKSWGVPVMAGEGEAGLLADPEQNMSGMVGADAVAIKCDRLLGDGEEFRLIGFDWVAMHTPGHTAGSMCYYIPAEKTLISGDTLFHESFGRTDFVTGDMTQIIESIGVKLMALPEDTLVYPGHMDSTSIGHEKRHNPVATFYLRRQQRG
jgi:glyoxylase-like metal-dependent hydrolase (beta-lactamase superfamily II)